MKQPARLLAFLGIVLGLAGSPSAGQGAAPQTPTFRVNVEYVEVDAVVTDRDGRFVRDLKQEDFEIFEDGKPQPISAFSIVDIPVDQLQRPLYAPQPIEPDVKSNERPFDGRIYVMLIDDLHTSAGRTARVRQAARQFIERNLGANDLMAVVHTSAARSTRRR
jgi:VWFA-related protein